MGKEYEWEANYVYKRNVSRVIRLIVLIIAILIALLIAILMLAFSQAFQDWTYDKLPNGYVIDRVNSENIRLNKGDSSDLRIDRYILEFVIMIPILV